MQTRTQLYTKYSQLWGHKKFTSRPDLTYPVASSASATFDVHNVGHMELWRVHSSKSLDTCDQRGTVHKIIFLPFCPSSASSQAQVSIVVVYNLRETAASLLCELWNCEKFWCRGCGLQALKNVELAVVLAIDLEFLNVLPRECVK